MEKGKTAVIAKRKKLCIIFKNRLKLFFVVLISCALHAQPGVSIEQKKQYFNEYTLEIKKRPDDVDLRIKRIRITQLDNTYIHIKEEYHKRTLNIFYLNNNDFLEDLNIIIENRKSLKYEFLRGRFFYITGEPKKGLDIWLKLIEDNKNLIDKDPALFNDINVSIASYYYNFSKKLTIENAKITLDYLSKLSIEGFHNQMHDKFAKEKIELFVFLEDMEGLENYYKQLILLENNNLNNEREFFLKDTYFSQMLKYAFELLEFYKKNGNTEKYFFYKNQLDKIPLDDYLKQRENNWNYEIRERIKEEINKNL